MLESKTENTINKRVTLGHDVDKIYIVSAREETQREGTKRGERLHLEEELEEIYANSKRKFLIY